MTSYDGSIETSIYLKPFMGYNWFVHGPIENGGCGLHIMHERIVTNKLQQQQDIHRVSPIWRHDRCARGCKTLGYGRNVLCVDFENTGNLLEVPFHLDEQPAMDESFFA
jgi:hypothetical protein